MPDQGAPVSTIQNSFAAGELTPKLYGRTDLQKYHSGCAFLRNFYVDYRGGVTARPGTQYMGAPGSDGYTRLIPFQFSPKIGQTYMLVFSDMKLRFVKNPGGAAYPNSSNAAYVQSAGVPYEIATPYAEVALRGLHHLQIADVMWLTAHGYPRMKLNRLADNNWTLTAVSTIPPIATPAITAITISGLPAGSPDPQTTRYMYVVTAVNVNGVESLPSTPGRSGPGIDLATTLGTVTVFWAPVAGAQYYKVYKALQTSGDRVPSYTEQVGFVGYAYGTIFTDSNIVPDFKTAPLIENDPFNVRGIAGYTITASSADWPVGATDITVTDGTGTGAVIYPVLDTNIAAASGHIVGLYIANTGRNYTAPTLTATGGGTTFTATTTLNPASGVDPDVVGTVQQRIVYASTDQKPNSVFAGRPGVSDDFRITNPVVDNDAFEFAIASTQVNDILWLQAMPGGLVIGTNSGIVQLTGGSSSAANPTAITPTNAVIVPQSNYGTADIPPIVVDYDILFVTQSGLVIDLQYNFFVNIFTGTDISVLSSHLFDGQMIVEWAYQDTPRKVVWAVRDDGVLLSLTYLKAQEIQGWAHHDTVGLYESIASVQEGSEVAVYVSVRRYGLARRFIERLVGSRWKQRSDAWQLDCALSTASPYPLVTTVSGLGHLEGRVVMALVDGVVQGPFAVTGGSITLTVAGRMIVVGLPFVCQLQPLYLDVSGETTIQGRRKKITAASVRVENSARLRYGIDFAATQEWVAGQSSTDPKLSLPYPSADLYTGDQRIVLNQQFTVGGWVCVEQRYPLPAQILSIEPEFAQGDTR